MDHTHAYIISCSPAEMSLGKVRRQRGIPFRFDPQPHWTCEHAINKVSRWQIICHDFLDTCYTLFTSGTIKHSRDDSSQFISGITCMQQVVDHYLMLMRPGWSGKTRIACEASAFSPEGGRTRTTTDTRAFSAEKGMADCRYPAKPLVIRFRSLLSPDNLLGHG